MEVLGSGLKVVYFWDIEEILWTSLLSSLKFTLLELEADLVFDSVPKDTALLLVETLPVGLNSSKASLTV